tara:strand:- start:4527 stop:5015 length:489 start_codon:yes stop_codon:yes gene_type:complete
MEDSKRGLIIIVVMNLIIIQTFATWNERFDKGYQEEEIVIIVEIDFGSGELNEEIYETSGNMELEYVNNTWRFIANYTTQYTNSWWIWTLFSAEYGIKYTSTYYSGLGEMIEAIDGVESKTNVNETGGRYWALYINEMYAEAGASSTYLNDGDKLTWKLDTW